MASKVELIIFTRPYNSKIAVNDPDLPDTGSSAKAMPASNGGKNSSGESSILNRLAKPPVPPSDTNPGEYFTMGVNPNNTVTPYLPPISLASAGAQGLRIDLYDDISIPITYTILDIREPDKRKTAWTKTLTVPGTKNNSRIFNHIYDMTRDSWVTIGNYHVYQGFNPNLRKEVILLQDGVQVFKGNLQLKKVSKKTGEQIEYDILLSGDLTSLFFDVGNAKIGDLDFSEWDHSWSKQNIVGSWHGDLVRNGSWFGNRNGQQTGGYVVNVSRQVSTGRVQFNMSSVHTLVAGDYVRTFGSSQGFAKSLNSILGDFMVSEVLSSTSFTINHIYPLALHENSEAIALNTFIVYKSVVNGMGYVYPMISWGDEYDSDSFPVTSFVPGMYVKEVWDKIMKKTNSTYVSNFLETQMFKRLVLIQKKDSYEANPREIAQGKFRVGIDSNRAVRTLWTTATRMSCTENNIFSPTGSLLESIQNQPTTYNATVDPGNKMVIPFSLESGGFGTGSYCDGNCDGSTYSSNNWNSSTYRWKVINAGKYQLQTSMNFSIACDMDGKTNQTTNPNNSSANGGVANGTASMNPGSGGINSDGYGDYWPGSNSSADSYSATPYNAYAPAHGFAAGDTGAYIGLVIKLKRNGTTRVIAQNGKIFLLDPAQGWSKIYGWSGFYNNGAYYPATGWRYFGRYQPVNDTRVSGGSQVGDWDNANILTQLDDYFFMTGDEVWAESLYFINGVDRYTSSGISDRRAICFWEYNNQTQRVTDIMGKWKFQLKAPTVMWNTPANKSSENSLLTANKFMPKDMLIKDFLTSIIKMFNLHIAPDNQIERKYYIEPRDDYYYTGSNGISDYVDWSDKIDETSIDIIPMGELIAKTYTFENKTETDYWNKKFKEDRGRDYMKYSKEIENDFLKNEQKVSVAFGSTVMINDPENSDVVIPAILQKESDGSYKPISNSTPRILFWGGVKPYLASQGTSILNTGWELLSSVEVASAQGYGTSSKYTWYPYAGTVDSPKDPHYDLNWFNMEAGDFVYWNNARWSDHNLYNAYWRNMINEISDPSSIVLSAYFRLNASDISQLDFRKIYNVGGNYLRLQKIIDYDPVGDGLTKCELLKLKSPTRFTRRSVWSGEVIDIIKTYGTINREVLYYGPIKRSFIGGGYGNTTPVNVKTITISGKGNYIGTSKNVKVNGDENHIGDGAINVHISNGNSNRINGGMSNVTIIGTHNKVISESDVTYVNDIRYKNGVPISRASVIHGGFDVVLPTNGSNTVANIVHGGEDEANPAGSATFETVIHAGHDKILPDLAELGLSTYTTPNPKTNYVGGAGYVVGVTQSTVDLVRKNRSGSQFNL